MGSPLGPTKEMGPGEFGVCRTLRWGKYEDSSRVNFTAKDFNGMYHSPRLFFLVQFVLIEGTPKSRIEPLILGVVTKMSPSTITKIFSLVIPRTYRGERCFCKRIPFLS